jgi:hypothetical protein
MAKHIEVVQGQRIAGTVTIHYFEEHRALYEICGALRILIELFDSCKQVS